MASRVGDVVVEVDTVEVMVIIVEEGLLERGEIGVVEVDLVDPRVEEEEGDLASNRYMYAFLILSSASQLLNFVLMFFPFNMLHFCGSQQRWKPIVSCDYNSRLLFAGFCTT